jgi:hypothetical protein
MIIPTSQIQILPALDALTDRYLALAGVQELSSSEYASQWRTLADEAAQQGRENLAASCYARADFYGKQEPGEYIRLIEGSLSELILVEAAT